MIQKKICTECTRREFLVVGAQTVSLAALVATVAACGSSKKEAEKTTPVTSDDSGKSFLLTFAEHPELNTVGGSIAATLKSSKGDLSVYVTRVSTDKATTLTTTCTHAQCTIGTYSSSSEQFTCPCHGSVFNSDGSVANGPASSPLTSYTTAIESSGIRITV